MEYAGSNQEPLKLNNLFFAPQRLRQPGKDAAQSTLAQALMRRNRL
jgi:hypothetical protein